MKLKALAVFITLVALASISAASARAAEVVGNESADLRWDYPSSPKKFHVYYGESTTSKTNTVDLHGTSRGLRVSHLKPCTTYYWNVNVLSPNGRTQWLWGTDKKFVTGGVDCPRTQVRTTMNRPVLGTTSNYQYQQTYNSYGGLFSDSVLGDTTMPAQTCTTTGKATVWWNGSGGRAAARYHVYYSHVHGQQHHAVRNLQQSVNSVELGYLDTCQTYYYSVQAVGFDGSTWWVGTGSVKPRV